jgi:pantoate--beta-alanine ligase
MLLTGSRYSGNSSITFSRQLLNILIFASIFSEMKTIRQINEFRDILKSFRKEGKLIGLVPTMGSLHDGHLSLIDTCMVTDDVTVVSIFVNPTQFNDKNDYRRYPRNARKDLELLRKRKCHFAFLPSEKEIYPEKDSRKFDFGYLDKHMEGKFRPGHFNGVAQIVSKLFNIIEPDHAYFGEKDFQQLVIVKALVSQLNLPVQIISCPVIREQDGLAISSRNLLLTPSQRKSAARIYAILSKIKDYADQMEINELKEYIKHEIDLDPNLQTEYFEIVQETNLKPVNSWNENGSKRGCIAVKIGPIRLIDNIKIS